jgi:hypothetical protein
LPDRIEREGAKLIVVVVSGEDRDRVPGGAVTFILDLDRAALGGWVVDRGVRIPVAIDELSDAEEVFFSCLAQIGELSDLIVDVELDGPEYLQELLPREMAEELRCVSAVGAGQSGLNLGLSATDLEVTFSA